MSTGQPVPGGVSIQTAWWRFSENNRVVSLHGFGLRGWLAPPGAFNPDTPHGAPLTLAHTVP